MGAPFGLFGGGGFALALPHAIGIAFEQGDVGVMGEAVEESGDAGGVGEDGVPFLKAFIGSQDDGIAFVTVVDDFEQQVGGVGIVGEIPYFVH
jgi:hypothetical protein